MEQEIILYMGAIALGALHAFEPGHGKTLIAAYMIGTRGRALDGILLGFIVTFTHTFSVIILGIVAKILSRHYSETELHAWLGLASSLLILAVGMWMLKQRISGKAGHRHLHLFGKKHEHHDHTHNHGHDKSHEHNNHDQGHSHDSAHDHSHDHTPDHSHASAYGHNHDYTPDHSHASAYGHNHDYTPDHSHASAYGHNHDHTPDHSHASAHGHSQVARKSESFTKWNLLLLGVSGGLIPCPAAIATLLAAIGAGRIAQGLTMVIFFSLGLGLVMMIIGLVLSQAGRFIENLGSNQEFSRRMGIVSALIIIVLGCITLYHSVVSLSVT